ncbi:ABC transporter permease subunit [candidate division KSB3 bacterium]|nr:ABC transporter permease subunit [candidate division KSB3 bacterium]
MASRRIRNLFLTPAIIYLLIMSIYPFVYSLYLSTTRKNLSRPYQKGFIGLENYSTLFTNNLFQTAIENTLVLTVASIAIELMLGFFIARLFVAISDVPGNNIIRTVYILPMMITPVVSGLLWSYILSPSLGVANYILREVGLDPYPWLASSDTALKSLVMINVWQWSPFLMLLMLAGLTSIPREQYEAAAIDGANILQIVRHIELPFLRNVVLIGVIFRVIDNFRLFDVVYVTTRGGPGSSTEVVSMYTYREMFGFFNVGYGSSAAVIILIMAIIVTNILYRFMREEETHVG